MRWFILLIVFSASTACTPAPYDVAEKTIAQLQADLTANRITSERLVQAYIARIETIDRSGPTLNSVLALNPNALDDARALDVERKAKGPRGPLHGIPLLIKDNIETADPLATTAGSLALAGNITGRDAPVIARLRAAGAIVLGKANMSEWANIRSSHPISGWSAIGGLVRNPYSLDRSASGSSSGSGAAVAANLAAAALGTETDGSLVSPASFNGIVSIKPTVGLLSRTNIIPISHSQDTPGPMTRSVADAALLLTIMAGRDPADAATLSADERKTDYVAALSSASLTGKRLGYIASDIPSTDAGKIFRQALAALRAAGAEIVEIDGTTAKPPTAALDAELLILEYELKADLDTYLAGLPRGAKVKTLADVIAFNEATPRETVLFGQDLFEDAQVLGGLGDPSYLSAHDKLQNFSRGVLDELFADNRLDALISTTYDAAFRVDAIRGDISGGDFSSFLPATAGYPHLTVPMGYVGGLPVGLSIIGPAWSEAILLQLGFAFEQATHARKPPNYTPSLESSASVAAFAPNAPEIQAR